MGLAHMCRKFTSRDLPEFSPHRVNETIVEPGEAQFARLTRLLAKASACYMLQAV